MAADGTPALRFRLALGALALLSIAPACSLDGGSIALPCGLDSDLLEPAAISRNFIAGADGATQIATEYQLDMGAEGRVQFAYRALEEACLQRGFTVSWEINRITWFSGDPTSVGGARSVGATFQILEGTCPESDCSQSLDLLFLWLDEGDEGENVP